MGKAADNRHSQIQYVQNRVNMLQHVVQSMDAHSVEVEDLDQLLHLMNELEGKIERFKKDWQDGRS
ncbi:SE1561 family protein [Pontibacillus salicampi]|uniref:SE1561 family protein n=1 Tax=Pontibacillus salicampi TaxID=1449801 RepID=A0ABV6LS15_9BACI